MIVRNSSKWSKHKTLRRHASLASVLPETVWLTEASLRRMLSKHHNVVLKPTHKWGGQGILFVSEAGDGRYRVQWDKSSRVLVGLGQTWKHVRRIRLSPWYIVQRRIPLATIHGRPFDIRVMAQRGRRAPWTVTGKLAKIAGSGYLVTNALRSRGTVDTVPNAIRRSSAVLSSSVEQVGKNIDEIALRIARKLALAYPGIRIVGLDMGLDTEGKVWLIEANFAPMSSLFRRLKDQSMYRSIISFPRKTR